MMTAIGDKLKEADPMRALGAEFYAKATEALKAHKSVSDACRAIEPWLRVQLTRIWGDIKNQLGDQLSDDTQDLNVPQPASGGHSTDDAHDKTAAARSTSQPKQPKPFFPQKGKSEAEKEITRRAALAGSSLWVELGMDRLRYRELDAFIREQILAGAGHAKRAHYQAKRAAIAWLVKQHGQPADPNALIKDCVTEKDAARFGAMGERQAGLIIAKLVQQTAVEIESGVKLIAAE
jgi:hypothetical protein